MICFSLVILAGSAVANILITRFKLSLSINNYAQSFGISILLSLVTFIINLIFEIVLPYMCLLEKNHTKTSYNFSISSKLSFAIFLNSAIIPLVEYDRNAYFSNSGLIITLWLNWILLAVVNPLKELINLKYIFNEILIYFAKNKGKQSLLTQKEANKLFEGPEPYIPDKYSSISSLMFYTAFYISFIPLGVILSLIGFTLYFIVDKYVMLRRYRKPENISHHITIYSIQYIGHGCLILFVVL